MSNVRKALIKLLLSAVVLVALLFLWLTNINGGLGILSIFVVVLAFPITLLLGIDASRVIKREIPSHKSIRVLGKVLGFPQAVMGMILIAFGAVYPFFGIRSIVDDMSRSVIPIVPLAWIAFAVLGLILGIYYVREGFDIRKRK